MGVAVDVAAAAACACELVVTTVAEIEAIALQRAEKECKR